MAAPPTKTNFWWMFTAAYICYAASLLALIAVYGNGLELGVLLMPACVFGLWAVKAPRGAAIGLVVVIAFGTFNNFVFALSTSWCFLLLPVQLAALALGIQAITFAAAFLAGERRREQAAIDYERKYRWQT